MARPRQDRRLDSQSCASNNCFFSSIVRPFWPEKHRTGAWRGRQSNDGSIQPLLQDQQWTVQGKPCRACRRQTRTDSDVISFLDKERID